MINYGANVILQFMNYVSPCNTCTFYNCAYDDKTDANDNSTKTCI